MPSLVMYLADDDVADLCRMLHDDPEIALVRADGPGRWKAQRDVPKLADGPYALWHVPSGPITLEPTDDTRPKRVSRPFAGWREIVKPFEPGVPWFGPAPTGIIYLTLRRKAGPRERTYSPMTTRPWTAPADQVIGVSEFSWIGNYYSIIGNAAPESTVRWWKSLRQRAAKTAVRVPNAGPLSGKVKDVWAFPAALAEIKKGRKRADGPVG